jgi:hypothetical protein
MEDWLRPASRRGHQPAELPILIIYILKIFIITCERVLPELGRFPRHLGEDRRSEDEKGPAGRPLTRPPSDSSPSGEAMKTVPAGSESRGKGAGRSG